VIWTIATWVIIGWGTLAVVYAVGSALLKFPSRTVDDVTAFLLPVDLEQAEALLDPATYFQLRWNLDPQSLKETQRKRLHLYLEIVTRMAHNARVLIELGNREVDRQEGRAVELIRNLQQEAVKVRAYSLFTALKLRVLLAIRPAQAPSLTKFRTLVDIDGIASYKCLRVASAELFNEFRRPLNVDF
jgi:hypothetical protein